METTKKSRDTIQSLSIGISILDTIAKARRPLKITEIQAETNITKSNLYKYINTLVQDDLIFRDQNSGLYHLGSKLIQYGMTAMGNQDVLAIISPYLQSISEHTNNTALFSVPTFNGPVIAKITRSNQILNIGAEIGTLLPPYSAAGKIFNLFAEQQKTKKWKENYQSTIMEDLDEAQIIRKEKIAFAKEPLISEVSSVALPILNYLNELIGIITLVGFSSDIPGTIDDPQSKFLQKMRVEISKNF
ncbi:helix-turn-helix domain-containing protein [Fredinandcohnia sp. QZ13]|uniref:IclR family transcriptional regulator n=1 Tax=Fredinandcohnia sp. QZ13 TaxID=3073144 RepID=UPI0028531954|nr:helix-turn-helix domain-containing protein [Fredinandcohnia sp. QZ13]MDR4887396.1 helix-turn-helix domain-containing protein [Fredinandcohnia sp. QZ13]